MDDFYPYNLRPLKRTDLDKILYWRNSDRVRRYMYTDHLITYVEHKKWYEKIRDSESDLYMIFEIKNTPVGLTSLTNIDRRNQKCNWGFYLGEENLKPGTGSIMGFLSMEYAFKDLGIRKVCGEVLAFNQASIKLFKKLGFKEEGVLKKHIIKNSNYEDVILFALFSDLWEAEKDKIQESVRGAIL